jgi:DNA polymerase-3 subunit delta'
MAWDSVIGQYRVKELLRRSIERGTIAHAYLFSGTEGIGKDALALEFAKVLNCVDQTTAACGVCPSCLQAGAFHHPNINFITALPVGKGENQGDDPVSVLSDDQVEEYRSALEEKARDAYRRIELDKANFIKINSIRQIKRETAMALSRSGKKIFIISGAERMNADASNSLLKTLEEPPNDTVLLLTTAEKNRLLPTILSRCQLLHCDALTEQEISSALTARDGIEEKQAYIAAELSNGSYSVARELSEGDIARERQEVLTFLRLVVGNQKIQSARFVEAFVNERGKKSLERWLGQLQAWLREVMLLRETKEHQTGVNDRESQEKFVDRFRNADLPRAISAVETAIVHLHKNVYLPLVFLRLHTELRKYILNG